MIFSVIDVETTGLSAHGGDRLLEIGVVRLTEDGEINDRIDTLINPGSKVRATHIHGIDDEMVADAPSFSSIASYLAKELAGTVVTAHNARFDIGFLLAEFHRAGYPTINMPALCTLIMARKQFSFLPSRSLASCRNHLGVSDSGAHSALADARATAIMLRHFIDNAEIPIGTAAFRLPDGISNEPMLFDDTPRFKSRSNCR